MSKNKYILPMKDVWYVEYGGITKENSHSWDIISQRYAYDFEIRKENLPYHNDYKNKENFYSYNKEIIAPLDGWIVDIENIYDDTKILEGRPIVCDAKDPRGNYIIIKHLNNEYSLIDHIKKDSFKVQIGDIVKEGQIIAKVGNSGNTEGPHIHFQVQDSEDFYSCNGIPITFKNVLKKNNNKYKKIKYLNKNIYVKNKTH